MIKWASVVLWMMHKAAMIFAMFVLQKELYRNMALAFGCVVVLTLFLIADIATCVFVSICVLSTLVSLSMFLSKRLVGNLLL